MTSKNLTGHLWWKSWLVFCNGNPGVFFAKGQQCGTRFHAIMSLWVQVLLTPLVHRQTVYMYLLRTICMITYMSHTCDDWLIIVQACYNSSYMFHLLRNQAACTTSIDIWLLSVSSLDKSGLYIKLIYWVIIRDPLNIKMYTDKIILLWNEYS